MILVPILMNAAVIRGKIVDGNNQEGVDGALVKLLRVDVDTTYIDGAVTDSLGYFAFQGVRNGQYSIQTECLGYFPRSKYVRVQGSDVRIDSITMATNATMLAETVVTGRRPDVVVKQDTVEYAAEAYTISQNSMVEDLLRSIPGIEIDENGKITAHGKEVKKLLVGGKELFAGDTKTAMQNFPVDVIDKLQVVDRKSEVARMTGVDDGNDETVINLTVKKEKSNGWFGRVRAGYGTENKYRGNINANHFWGENQLTIIGNANNTNGADARHQDLGVNLNIAQKKKFSVEAHATFNNNDNNTYRHMNREYIYSDSTSYYEEEANAHNTNHKLNGEARMVWRPDSVNTFNFRPTFSLTGSGVDRMTTSKTNAGDANRSAVNSSDREYGTNNDGIAMSGDMIFSHRFKKRRGRNFSVRIRYDYGDADAHIRSYTRNRYYLVPDKDGDIAQYTDNHSWNNSVLGRVSWTEPIGDIKKAMFVTAFYQAQVKLKDADKYVYDFDELDDDVKFGTLNRYDEYGTVNDDQSDIFRNKFFNQSAQIGFRKVHKKYNLNIGGTVNSAMTKSNDKMDAARSMGERWTLHLAPFVRLRWKFNKQTNLSVDYRTRTVDPAMNYLQPVADKQNPLNTIVGNPDLNATFTHVINAQYKDYRPKKQQSFMWDVAAQFSRNSIVSKTESDKTTGGKTTTYENVNGVWNVRTSTILSMPVYKRLLYFSNNASVRVNRTITYTNKAYNHSTAWSLFEQPSISIRPNRFELVIRPKYELQMTRNSISTKRDKKVHYYGCGVTMRYELPLDMKYYTTLQYSDSHGLSAGFSNEQWLWNMTLECTLLRDKSLFVQAQVYDLLKQRKSVTKLVNAQYEQETQATVIPRYGMVTMIYKFTSFGGHSFKR